MPGPLPNESALRRKTHAPTIPTTNLPVSGYRGDIPEPTIPFEAGSVAGALYAKAWRTPEAASWHESDADIVAEWAGLKALVLTKLRDGEEPSSAMLGQIQSREDRLLMSTLARSKARARIVDDPPELEEETGTVAQAWNPADFGTE